MHVLMGRKTNFQACIAPWPLLQSIPFLHCGCPPGRTANLIKFVPKYMYEIQSFDFFSFVSS